MCVSVCVCVFYIYNYKIYRKFLAEEGRITPRNWQGQHFIIIHMHRQTHISSSYGIKLDHQNMIHWTWYELRDTQRDQQQGPAEPAEWMADQPACWGGACRRILGYRERSRIFRVRRARVKIFLASHLYILSLLRGALRNIWLTRSLLSYALKCPTYNEVG